MNKYILGFLAAVIAWLTLVGSVMACYLVVQVSHPHVTSAERNYDTCLQHTHYGSDSGCSTVLKVNK